MVDHLSRQQLYDLVWSEPVSKIAPRFGVSDVWLAKICRAANIPLPPRGHWAKLVHGKASERTPLPRATDGVPSTVVITRGKPNQPESRSEEDEQIKAAVATSPPIPVPRELRQPHPFVAATRLQARTALAQADGRLYIGPEPGVFRLRVSRNALGRALRVLQAICNEAERREWEIKPRS